MRTGKWNIIAFAKAELIQYLPALTSYLINFQSFEQKQISNLANKIRSHSQYSYI